MLESGPPDSSPPSEDFCHELYLGLYRIKRRRRGQNDQLNRAILAQPLPALSHYSPITMSSHLFAHLERIHH